MPEQHDDFPISWDDPEHEDMHWFWDQMHHPRPVTPITYTLDGPAFTGGIGDANATFSRPAFAPLVGSFNYYWYMGYSGEMTGADPRQSPELQAELAQRAMRALDDWDNVYLPEVMQHNHRLRDYPYADASLGELAAFLDEVAAIRRRQWDIHFQAVMPVMGATFMFADTYESFFEAPPANEHYRMLQGFPNKSVEAGQALYDIAQDVRRDAALAGTVRETAAERLLAELERTAAGRDLLAKFNAYLDEYGWRSDNFELRDPSWREDPRPAVSNLKAFLRDNAVDPRLEQARAVEDRERLVGETLERLAGDERRLNLMKGLLQIAQQYLPIQENHNFYIDQMNTVLLRLPLLAVGRRLAAAGALEAPEDVFFLTLAEIQDAAAGRDGTRALATRREGEWQRWRGVVPPMFIGRPFADDSPMMRSFSRFFGGDVAVSRDPKVITGHGVSRGTVTAPAKVVRDLSESDKLEQGDVLVCNMTMPAWTPLFSVVSAVVADTGGVLSHCAIVAREYGLPCVAGTRIGTQVIRDGQMITVDGAKGIVRIEE